jgi:hypothetical protein
MEVPTSPWGLRNKHCTKPRRVHDENGDDDDDE